MSFCCFPTRTIFWTLSFFLFFPHFFSLLRFRQTRCTWHFLIAAAASILWGTFSCHTTGVHTSHGGGEITRRQSSRAAAKMGSYCLENKFRVCGQMVLMVEVCTQVEGSKFLKNTWVWWYSFFRGAKL